MAITVAAHVPPIRASQGKILVTAVAMAQLNHAASVAHPATNSHARHVRNNNGKTRAAPVLTWETNATTSTSVSPPVMYQRAFHHQACQRVAVAVVEAATVAVAAAHAQVVAVAVGVIRAAGFGADLHINHRQID